MPSIIGELGAHQAIKADAFLRGPYGKGAMGLRRYAHHEFAAVGAVRHWRRLFTVGLQSTLSATSFRIPEKASSWEDASQLNRGNSAHSPTNSPSSADQVTL